jgi:hypothetical protein
VCLCVFVCVLCVGGVGGELEEERVVAAAAAAAAAPQPARLELLSGNGSKRVRGQRLVEIVTF